MKKINLMDALGIDKIEVFDEDSFWRNAFCQEKAAILAKSIDLTFRWEKTIDGYDYWINLYSQLQRFGNKQPEQPYTLDRLIQTVKESGIWNQLHDEIVWADILRRLENVRSSPGFNQ